MTTPFSPTDMEFANEHFGAMCGHGALAAALGVPVLHVMPLFDKAGWVNIPGMKAAIQHAGRAYRKAPRPPERGVAVVLVQFLGSWMEPQVPFAARCAHRHWVAVNDMRVWDVNRPEWISTAEWLAWLPTIYGRGVTGHEIDSVWVIQ